MAGGYALLVFERDVTEREAQQMDQTGITFGSWGRPPLCLGEAFKAIHAGDEDVSPRAPQLRDDGQPELEL